MTVIPQLANSRFNPFAGTQDENTISAETHIVPRKAPFYVALAEAPKRSAPSSVRIPGFVEVEGSPNPGEFRVDYTYGTGLVQFNAADGGRTASVSYTGLGSAALIEWVQRIVGHDPADSFTGNWWRFEEVGDHFSAVNSFRMDRWASWTNSVGMPDETKHEAHFNSNGAKQYLQGHSYARAGDGCIIAARVKFSQDNNNMADSRNWAVGVWSITSAGTLTTNFGFKTIASDRTSGRFDFYWRDRSLTGQRFAVTAPSALTNYHELRAVYKDVPNTVGLLSIYVDGALVANTFAAVSTTALARPSLYCNDENMGGSLGMYVDYFAFVPLGANPLS